MSKVAFEGEILNPQGEIIYITCRVFNDLRKYAIQDRDTGKSIRAIVWNKQRQMYQLTQLAISLMPLWDSPEFRPRKTLSAMNPSRMTDGGAPKHGGRSNFILTTLGTDLSGLPCNPVEPKPINRGI
jgi:hypothetical protein